MRGRSEDGTLIKDNSLDFLTESEAEWMQDLGVLLGKPEEPNGFSFYFRWIPEKSDHGQLYANIGYQFTDSFRAGLDWRPLTDDVTPLINWRVFSENDTWRPALIVGMSNDDFGDINSDSYYATLSKYVGSIGETNFSLYGGGTFIEELDELRPVGGIHVSNGPWSGLFMYSGVDPHISVSRKFGNHTLTFLMFDMELPGLAYGFAF